MTIVSFDPHAHWGDLSGGTVHVNPKFVVTRAFRGLDQFTGTWVPVANEPIVERKSLSCCIPEAD